VVIHHPGLVNLYGCEIGVGTTIGPFVEMMFIRRCYMVSRRFLILRGVIDILVEPNAER